MNESLYNVFEELSISYKEVEHEFVYNVEQAQHIKSMIEGIGCKNIFLRDTKLNYYLVILKDNKRANLKNIAKIVGTSHLSLASKEELEELLFLKQGSVSPFGIIYDKDNKVIILIDKDLIDLKLLFHPNTNNKTVSIIFHDLIKFILYENHEYLLI